MLGSIILPIPQSTYIRGWGNYCLYCKESCSSIYKKEPRCQGSPCQVKSIIVRLALMLRGPHNKKKEQAKAELYSQTSLPEVPGRATPCQACQATQHNTRPCNTTPDVSDHAARCQTARCQACQAMQHDQHTK
eukprot:scaffold39489_cov19-Tisochrysis_lutea.AAC.4